MIYFENLIYGAIPLLDFPIFRVIPHARLGNKSWQDLTSPYPSGDRAVAIADTVMVYIIQTVHVDGAAAIFNGVTDVFGDDDRSSIGLIVTSLTYGKEFTAEQLVL